MTSSKQLCVVLPILLVAVVIVNQASAGQLQQLIEERFVPDFRKGGLVLPGRYTQFAIVAFLHTNKWMEFEYIPSVNGNGRKPIIDPSSSLSPPEEMKEEYDNYLAARPNERGHSEKQIVDNLENLYNQYTTKHGSPPQAMLLYSWIVPCVHCTDLLINTLKSEPYNSIPEKLVAYTTLGTKAECECDVEYTTERFKSNRLKLVWVPVQLPAEEMIENLIARLMFE